MRKPDFRSLGLAALIALTLPLAASAITLLPKCATDRTTEFSGQCGVSDILAVFVNLAEFLLGIMGAVALGFFVYGGFVWVLSGGEKDKVQKGKDILKNAVTGIAIIFLSGLIVRFTTRALTGGNSPIPIVGEDCRTTPKKAKGIWISLPAGYTDKVIPKVIPEETVCIPTKDGCKELQAKLKERGRTEVYSCVSLAEGKATTCVRGLCSGGADKVCCLTSGGGSQ